MFSEKALSSNVLHMPGSPWGARQCDNRGRQQLAVSGEQFGRTDLLKRQTDGGYPSCVRRTRRVEASEVELGCYELCGCTKGRQRGRVFFPLRMRIVRTTAHRSWDLLCGSGSSAWRVQGCRYGLWLWELSLINFLLTNQSEERVWPIFAKHNHRRRSFN